jgi:hypothetical protein
MGFFDKVKQFAGGASMVGIEFTSIERQPPGSASMPIGDSVIKGQYRITANKACTVLRHIAQLRTRCAEKDGTLGTCRAESIYDETRQVYGAPYQFPYELKAGETMEAGFNITDVDIPSYFAAYGVAPKDPSVEVFVKVIVDVKGSPFDPDAEITVKMV